MASTTASTASTADPTIDEHLSWLRRRGATPATLRLRRGVLERLSRALGIPLLQARDEHLDRWQAGLRVSLSTVSSYTSGVCVFYRWAAEHDLIAADPARRLPRPKVPAGQPRPVPERDLEVALERAPEPIRTWLVLAACLGLRAMEVAGIRREDVVSVDGRPHLYGVGKGRRPFALPIPLHVVPVLAPHLVVASGPLWRTGPGGRPSRPRDVTTQTAAFFRGLGMPWTLHCLRHSFGTGMYRRTRDLLLVQDVMRHASPATTRIYVETASTAATAAMDRLSAGVCRSPAGRRDGRPGSAGARRRAGLTARRSPNRT